MTVSPETIQTALIAPLDALGWARGKGVTVKAFKAGRERLLSDLRYLDEAQLAVMVREAEALARAFQCWPAPALILARAHTLFPNPEIDREREAGIARFMACRVGQDALAAEPAYAVELLADLRTKGPGRVSGSAMEIARWREGAETRLYKLARARRREDGAAEVAFWEQRAAEAQGMVLRQAAEGGDAVEGRTVAA